MSWKGEKVCYYLLSLFRFLLFGWVCFVLIGFGFFFRKKKSLLFILNMIFKVVKKCHYLFSGY